MIIKISSMDRPSNIIRQTPGSKGNWGNFRFAINSPETEDCDWWVVLEGVPDIERANVPKRNTILITGEPPCIKQYQNGFLNQFSTIITCHSGLRHPHVMNTQQGLAWWVGLSTEGMKVVGYSKTYDDLNLTLHGHPDMHAPSVDVSWGSLRQGLSSDAEMALGPRLRKREFRVCILATGRWPVAGGTSVGGGRDSRCLSLGRPHRKRGLEQDLAQRVHRRGLSHDSCGGQAIRLLPAGVQVQGT